MGDDFEVYNPGNGFQYYGFVPQSGTELHPVSNATEELNAPLKDDSLMIGGKHIVNDKIPLVYMGESIKSFRTLLKRYNMHRRDMFFQHCWCKSLPWYTSTISRVTWTVWWG
jgi:hypothetical protein